MAENNFRLALIQLAVGKSKEDNLARAVEKVKEAAGTGANLVSLPSCQALKQAAEENKVYLIGGSIPEICDGEVFNTSTVWCPEGHLVATHRKIHLFDIDVPGKITFKESDALSPGNSLTTFSTPWCEVGLGICYDIRFPELAQVYRKRDCKIVVYPGAFDMNTGPAHWELLSRARALDNQMYVATPSCARDTSAYYTAWGHSSVVSPWGEVVAKAGEKEEIIYSDIDLKFLEEVRKQIPTGQQTRGDLYKVVDEKSVWNSWMKSNPRENTSYHLENLRMDELSSVEKLGDKTLFCQCLKKSEEFPCDNQDPLVFIKPKP